MNTRICHSLLVIGLRVGLTLGFCTDTSYFTAFGDWGWTKGGLSVVSDRLNSNTDSCGRSEFTILLGDNFYPNGVASVTDNHFKLFSMFSDSSDVFYVIAGNHDYGIPGSVDHQIAYSQVNSKWAFPSKYYTQIRTVPGSNTINMCMVFVDSMSFSEGSKQQAWFDKELARCRGIPNSLLVVSGHFPIYSKGKAADNKLIGDYRDAINPLLKKHKVHLYLSGHKHQMQAMIVDDIHYLVIGSAARRKGKLNQKFGNLVKFQSLEYGFASFSLETDDTLRYDFIRADSGAVVHSGSINFLKHVTEDAPSLATGVSQNSDDDANESPSIRTTKSIAARISATMPMVGFAVIVYGYL